MIEEFYKNLKKCLESDYFTDLLLYTGDINCDARRLFLVKALYFLISTRDFDNFNNYLNKWYKDIFPYQYLKEKTNLTDKEIKNMIYDNFIRNGFLFHVTPSNNVNDILSSGLKTLNDKYKCNLYKKSIELNLAYSQIRTRNANKTELLKNTSLISTPGSRACREDRFKTVFLSSNLDYILKTYGESGELFNFFIRDLQLSLNNYDNVDSLTKDELKNKVIKMIKKSNIQILDEEIMQILDYMETIYEDKKDNDTTKSILLVPTNSIVNNSNEFKCLYKENSFNLPIEDILAHDHGEIRSVGSISPDKIIAITTNKDKSLSLKINK